MIFILVMSCSIICSRLNALNRTTLRTTRTGTCFLLLILSFAWLSNFHIEIIEKLLLEKSKSNKPLTVPVNSYYDYFVQNFHITHTIHLFIQ